MKKIIVILLFSFQYLCFGHSPIEMNCLLASVNRLGTKLEDLQLKVYAGKEMGFSGNELTKFVDQAVNLHNLYKNKKINLYTYCTKEYEYSKNEYNFFSKKVDHQNKMNEKNIENLKSFNYDMKKIEEARKRIDKKYPK